MHVYNVLSKASYKLCIMGYDISTGDADGSDKAGREGASRAIADGATGRLFVYTAKQATPAAMEIAGTYHPYWHGIKKEYVRMLHGRNAFQVLGINLDQRALGLLCWTPDGCECHAERSIKTGGTGTAISIADAYEVPIANLHNPATFQKWRKWANEIRA
jgi:hypothetical protein